MSMHPPLMACFHLSSLAFVNLILLYSLIRVTRAALNIFSTYIKITYACFRIVSSWLRTVTRLKFNNKEFLDCSLNCLFRYWNISWQFHRIYFFVFFFFEFFNIVPRRYCFCPIYLCCVNLFNFVLLFIQLNISLNFFSINLLIHFL